MAIAKVDSVAVKDTVIRNYHLMKNLGKYSMYDEMLEPAVGTVYDVTTRELKHMTEDKGLLYHTHESNGQYAKDINWQYLNGEYNEADVVRVKPQKQQNMYSANGLDYRKYFYDIYGHEDVPIRFVNGLLAHESIEKALKMQETAVVENISPLESMAGVVKTNINNFSGTDTRLGLITNQLYANALYYGANFNTARQIALGANLTPSTVNAAMRFTDYTGGALGKSKLITPVSVKWYGNNTENMNNLPFLFVRDEATGRMATDHSEEVSVIHDIKDIDETNLNRVYLDDAIKQMKFFSPEEDKGYVRLVETTDKDTGELYEVIEDYDFDEEESKVGYGYSVSGRLQGPLVHVTYDEKDDGDSEAPDVSLLNQEDNEFDSFKRVRDDLDENSLLAKTNKMFRQNRIRTMQNRFYNNVNPDGSPDSEATFMDTAKNKIYGNSHGRNLVRRNALDGEKTNGYVNPYCRVWTKHHQYDRYNKMIRPFVGTAADELIESTKPYRSKAPNGNVSDGHEYLKDNTVLSSMGLVNITPIRSKVNDKEVVDLKRCMFSIENLAWKDVPRVDANLSAEQRGPNGGRIMWFPPYGLNFTESVNSQFDTNNFIGRGEPVYTYANTERRATLEFIMLIDYPSVINSVHNRDGNVNAPAYGDNTDVDDTEANILRYFAGCEPLKYKEKVEDEDGDRENEEENLEGSYKHEYIYVFFPNNYSGNKKEQELKKHSATTLRRIKKADELAKKMEEELDAEGLGRLCTDGIDASNYLIYGKNISPQTNITGATYNLDDETGLKIFGYEMADRMMGGITGITDYCPLKKGVTTGVCGISYTTDVKGAGKKDNNPEWCIRPCANPLRFSKCSGEDKSKDNSWNFYYAVDYDLHERITYASNRDLASYGLNSKVANVRNLSLGAEQYMKGENELFSNATASFAELWCALKSCGFLSENNGVANDVLEKYCYACGADKLNTKRLVSLFKSAAAIKSVNIKGCATEQHSETSDMLAIRRALMLKGLVKKVLSDASSDETSTCTVDTEFIKSSFNTMDRQLDGVNSSLGAKMGKMACIDIMYDENKLEKGDEEIAEEEDKVRDLFDELCENSEMFDNFSKMYGSDYYSVFKAWFEDMANAEGGSDGDSEHDKVVREFVSNNWDKSNNEWNDKPTFKE